MSRPAVIVKVTGHVGTAKLAGDLVSWMKLSRGNWQDEPLTLEQVPRPHREKPPHLCRHPDGPILRVPAEIQPQIDRHGVMRGQATGKISPQYAYHLQQLQTQGNSRYQKVVIGVRPLNPTHGFNLAQPRGTVVPLSSGHSIKSSGASLESDHAYRRGPEAFGQSPARPCPVAPAGSPRSEIHDRPDKVGRDSFAHNLAVAPHPRLLEQIRRAGQQVEQVMEAAARRVLEKIERRRTGKIIAVCSTHLQGRDNIRPHLHIRVAARDTAGKRGPSLSQQDLRQRRRSLHPPG